MSLTHRLSNRTRQRGQAILWFLTTAAACCAVFALVYNVGQVTTRRRKPFNAADASAISGALTEARILNFEAYTNRALIANECRSLSWSAWIPGGLQLRDHAVAGLLLRMDSVRGPGAEHDRLRDAGVCGRLKYGVSIQIPVIEVMNTGWRPHAIWKTAAGAFAANASRPGRPGNQDHLRQTATTNSRKWSAASASVAAGINEYAWYKFTDPYKGDQRAMPRR